MPCYITYRAFATISEKDYASFIEAIKAKGWNILDFTQSMGEVIIKDGQRVATLAREGLPGGYELSGDTKLCKSLIEEHNIRLVETEVKSKGRRTRRTTNKQGQLELIVIG
jgi:hypothetical protein